MSIIEKRATFMRLGGDEHQSATIAQITGHTPDEVQRVIEEIRSLTPAEGDALSHKMFGPFEDMMQKLVANGAALPVYHCIVERLEPFCVSRMVPRIDCPVSEACD